MPTYYSHSLPLNSKFYQDNPINPTKTPPEPVTLTARSASRQAYSNAPLNTTEAPTIATRVSAPLKRIATDASAPLNFHRRDHGSAIVPICTRQLELTGSGIHHVQAHITRALLDMREHDLIQNTQPNEGHCLTLI